MGHESKAIALLCGALLCSAGCKPEALQHAGRVCTVEYPCAAGFACVDQKCVRSTTIRDGSATLLDARVDRSGVTDGPPVGPKDGPPVGPTDGPLPGSEAQPPDVAVVDQMPAPDAGCPGALKRCGGVCVDTLTSFDHCGDCNQACQAGVADGCQSGQCHCGGGAVCDGAAGLNCHQGSCQCVTGASSLCTGCCEGTQCVAGDTVAACGSGGVSCVNCPNTDPCQDPVCASGGSCALADKPDGTSCTDVKTGKCRGGSCCTGCWTGSICVPGFDDFECGKLGNICFDCTPDLECLIGMCKPIFPDR